MSQNWELLAAGPLADAVERLNVASLCNVVEALVRTRLAARSGRAGPPDDAALRLLHRTATALLLKRPGRYRRAYVHLADPEGYLVYRAPPADKVGPLLTAFFRTLAAIWDREDALDVAAYALWRIASIHPFPNGNGRTAAAFGYACLCLKLGHVLPGRMTVLTQLIADSRPTYPLLQPAHEYHARTGKRPDLNGLKLYLDALLLRQMKAARSA